MTKSASEIILRSTVGIIPYVGPFLNELIDTFIPDQRMERLEHYQELLALKLSALSEDYLYSLESRPIHLSLLEKGYKEAVDASTKKRREFIASLVATGVGKDNLDAELTSHLFRILKEITDNEVILLRHCAAKFANEDLEFKIKFRELLEPINISLNAPDPELVRRKALKDNSFLTLRRLNLLDATLVTPKKNNTSMSARADEVQYKSSSVTHLGYAFLEYIDMLPVKSS